MRCQPERVTAYVDRELPPPLEHAVERLLSACTACAAQAAFEMELQATLSAVPPPRLRTGFPASVLHKASAKRHFAVELTPRYSSASRLLKPPKPSWDRAGLAGSTSQRAPSSWNL